MIRLIFVCLGNICRSPIAEGICRAALADDNFRTRMNGEISWDSAGLGDWHQGAAPDPRAIAVAKKHGIDIADLRARKIADDDFESFDLILAMDRDNVEGLRKRCPEQFADRIHLLMDFAHDSKIREVPDPYFFRDEAGFERVFTTIEEGVLGLLTHLRERRF
ncbi:low molecular weight protein-tyrosine-phosphatase [Govanella unica]|uniref:protein-tyrosine-phosphatase n=1 Tax=Govanella unica TaxID=2975056 RepID=A0A9X3TVV3_9PROT|nr:low molecular weight phosphotyrosine protein phosphatase [Govania unica]